MNIEQLEKIKDLTQKIEMVLNVEVQDQTSIYLKVNLMNFQKHLSFQQKKNCLRIIKREIIQYQ